ncbi:MAG: outer-membrane lipoprotein carrier protein LolA [Actinomycetota bacterium]
MRTSRWIPAGVAIVVVAAGTVAIPLAANAAPSIAPMTAKQVIELVENSTTRSFSGTLETSSDLGLPSLPSIPGASTASSSDTAGVSSILSLLSSPQKVRVYVDGKSKERVQVLTSLAEQDVIRNGTDLWQYDSKKNAVTHATLQSRTAPAPATTAPTATLTPSQLADSLLARLDSTTSTSVGTTKQVAGRDTYTLILKPKATDTLIGSVSISVDAKTGLPLAVDATARGQHDVALGIAFTSVSFSTPSASLFDFTPPKGATVTEQKAQPKSATPAKGTGTKPTVVGSGWDAVVETTAAGTSALTSQKLFSELTSPVNGGRVIHTSLANVLITTDGRVLAGSVSVDRLLAVAGQ